MRAAALSASAADSMEKIFGSANLQLLAHDGTKKPVTALSGTQVVGLYFSADWCPPSRAFTPKLAATYKTITAAGKSFEIVFVSSDQNEASFASYYNQMPWLAVPFDRYTSSLRPHTLVAEGQRPHTLVAEGPIH